MKLYPKKLRTIEDLEKEKKLLLKEKRKLDEEDIFSLKGILGKGGDDDDDDEKGGGFNISSLLSMLPISNPLVSMGVQMAGRIFSRKKKKAQNEDERTTSKKKPNRIRAIAFEILTGYLKWKAIELTYKATRNYIKKRRQHDRDRAAVSLDDDR